MFPYWLLYGLRIFLETNHMGVTKKAERKTERIETEIETKDSRY